MNKQCCHPEHLDAHRRVKAKDERAMLPPGGRREDSPGQAKRSPGLQCKEGSSPVGAKGTVPILGCSSGAESAVADGVEGSAFRLLKDAGCPRSRPPRRRTWETTTSPLVSLPEISSRRRTIEFVGRAKDRCQLSTEMGTPPPPLYPQGVYFQSPPIIQHAYNQLVT
jgi:hypothetical protein